MGGEVQNAFNCRFQYYQPMKIELLYFGRPAEKLRTARESINAPDELATLAELLAWLRLRGERAWLRRGLTPLIGQLATWLVSLD